MAFRNMLTPEQEQKFASQRVRHNRRNAELKQLTKLELAEKLIHTWHNSYTIAAKYDKGDPIYECSLFYNYIPEVIRRLGGNPDYCKICGADLRQLTR